jgi:UDP-GlcNAc:undecaprenyl-phosphate/decaprenyl-phosphate GlcNAc-1-phosphate transferase
MINPNVHFTDLFAYASLGFLAAVPLFALNVTFAKRLGLIDWPKARGLAENQIPIVGPSFILLAYLSFLVLAFFIPVSPWVLVCSGIIALMGYLDDRKSLPAFDKLFFQTVCSLAVVYLDPQLSNSLGGPLGQAGSVVFLVAVMNAVNFIDGIDGLAGMVLLSSFTALPFLSVGEAGSNALLILACILAGAIFPFLYVNVKLRKGFLGNSGSYFLSFLAALAYLSVTSAAPAATFPQFSLAALCFLVPFADAATVITVRLWGGRSPFKADKGHLHHRLVQTNIPLKYTLAVLGLIQFVGVSTAVYISPKGVASHPQLATIVLLGYGLVASTLILLLERASRIRVQAYFQRLDTGDPIYYLKYQVTKPDGSAVHARELVRLEAQFAAEIRVTDICTAQEADCLFVVLRTMAEPLKGISARLESVIHSEKQYVFHLIERGDFAKRVTEVVPSRKTA